MVTHGLQIKRGRIQSNTLKPTPQVLTFHECNRLCLSRIKANAQILFFVFVLLGGNLLLEIIPEEFTKG